MPTTDLPALVAELYDLATWIDAMPAVPGHHRNADALYETYQNCVDEAMGWDDTGRIAAALEYALEHDNETGSEADTWRLVADALEIELSTE